MFLHFNNTIVNSDIIKFVDCSNYIETGRISVHLTNKVELVVGAEAFDVIQRLCPAFLEGKRAKYIKHAWTIHNLIGHPGMQILTWLKLSKLGIKLHDITMPVPKIIK